MPATLHNYSGDASCGVRKVGGTSTTAYFTCVCELLNGMPDTVEDLGGTDPQDAFLYGEAYDFTGNASGDGYFRKMPLIVDEQELKNLIEGSKQGVSVGNTLDVKVPGSGPAHSAFVQSIVDYTGCLHFLIKLRDGNYATLGDIDNPVFVQPSEGTTGKVIGDVPGTMLSLRADTGFMVKFYDADNFGINTTPIL